MSKEKRAVEISEEELRDFHEFFEMELHSWATLTMAGLFLIWVILFLSKFELTPDSRFIYGIYVLFILTVGFTVIAAVKCLQVLLIMFLVDREKFTIFESSRVRHCANRTRGELKEKKFLILHVLWVRYAFRVEQKGGV